MKTLTCFFCETTFNSNWEPDLDDHNPVCDECRDEDETAPSEIIQKLATLEDQWTNGHPSEYLRRRIDSLRRQLAEVAP